MARLAYSDIRIQGGFGLQTLEKLRFRVTPNEHGVMELTGVVYMEAGFSEMEDQIVNTVVSAVKIDADGAAETPALFSGIVQSVEISVDSGVYRIKVKAVSATSLLDRHTKSRSFQDVKMTYEDVVNQVLRDTPHAHAIYSVGMGTAIGVPLIQYKETDWQFIRRLASHFNSPVIPETTECLPRLWFGMRQGMESRTFDSDEYTVAVDRKYYEMGGKGMGWRRADFLYYLADSDDAFSIGDNCRYFDKRLKICEKSGELRGGEFYFTYKLARESMAYVKTYFNEKACGMSLTGTVLETDHEVLKIHLDIDEKQDPAKAYNYKWKPATGNLVYLMPKVGTRVSLYLYNSDERSAVAVNCVRTNGAENADMADYNRRYLTTEHDKRYYYFPDSLGFVSDSGGASGLMIQMDDRSGILAQSHKKISMIATDSISINAPRFAMDCPQQITIKQGGTSLVINNQFDVLGAQGHIVGTGSAGTSIPEKGKDEYLRENASYDWCEQAGFVSGGTATFYNPSCADETMNECFGERKEFAQNTGAVTGTAAGTARIPREAIMEALEKAANK